jgi:hypothetical protein
MQFPKSEHLGTVKGPDGRDYRLEFYGENEGAAVINGPAPPPNTGRMLPVPEVHREDAKDTDDARTKLEAWLRAVGWKK